MAPRQRRRVSERRDPLRSRGSKTPWDRVTVSEGQQSTAFGSLESLKSGAVPPSCGIITTVPTETSSFAAPLRPPEGATPVRLQIQFPVPLFPIPIPTTSTPCPWSDRTHNTVHYVRYDAPCAVVLSACYAEGGVVRQPSADGEGGAN